MFLLFWATPKCTPELLTLYPSLLALLPLEPETRCGEFNLSLLHARIHSALAAISAAQR